MTINKCVKKCTLATPTEKRRDCMYTYPKAYFKYT